MRLRSALRVVALALACLVPACQSAPADGLTDKQRGLEQFYEVVRLGTR